MTIFNDEGDYEAFERVLHAAVERTGTLLLTYTVMPNHWHLVVWPRRDGELSKFVGWLTLTHTQRWHAHRHSTGSGHVYQGRFKSFPVAADEHFYTVARYAERNPLRAKPVARAEVWQWSSLYRWLSDSPEDRVLLAPWPLSRRPGWVEHVNRPIRELELMAIRQSIDRGRPFGDPEWCQRAVRGLGLETTVRPRGRPKKSTKGS